MTTTGHIVLLGDSVFDNQSYVETGRATVDELRGQLPPEWRATLLAQDGSMTDEVARQLLGVASDATHLIVSTGGNDALSEVGILSERSATVGEALWKIAQVVERFERRYRAMVLKLRSRKVPAGVCTIYNGWFDDPYLQTITTTAVALFNDAIVRAAHAARMPVLDLRAICYEPEHFVSQIEPSALGSIQIARAVATFVRDALGAVPPK